MRPSGGERPYGVEIERDAGGAFTASCDCPYFQDRFVICKHIWASLLEAERRGYLLGDGDLPENSDARPRRSRRRAPIRMLHARGGRARAPGARRRGVRVPGRSSSRSSRATSREAESHTGAAALSPTAQIVYVIDRAATIAGDDARARSAVAAAQEERRVGPAEARAGRQRAISEDCRSAADRQIVPLLLGASDPSSPAMASRATFARASFRLAPPLVERVLPLIGQSGRTFLRVQPSPGEQLVQLGWDDGPPWTFRLEIVHASGDEGFSIDGALVRGDERLAVRAPWLVLPSGYIVHGNRIARLDPSGAFAWLAQLRGSGPMVIPPGATGQLLDVLARSGVDPSDLPDELQFEIVNESPRPWVSVRADTRGRPGLARRQPARQRHVRLRRARRVAGIRGDDVRFRAAGC